MRCDILTNWNTDKHGKCKRILCQFKGMKGCAIRKRREAMKKRLLELRREEEKLVG